MPFKIAEDEWLSEQLGKTTYRVNITKTLTEKDQIELEEWIDDQSGYDYFMYSKIPTSDIESVKHVEKAGFNLIDTNVLFIKKNPTSTKEKKNDNVVIHFSTPHDTDLVVSIARNNFIYSRFHVDPLINNETANMVKGKWVENFYLSRRGDYMVVGQAGEEIVGFLLLLINDDTLVIDLIGVEAKWQEQGVASAMIQFAQENIDHKEYKVGTQIGNVPAIRLYEKLGFLFSGSEYVFHFHSNTQGTP